MKKILIFSHALEIGGAERALLGMLETIDTTQYEVDLFLMRHTGELLDYIPDGINLLPEISQYASLAIPIKNVIKKRQFKIAYTRVCAKYYAKRRGKQLGFPRKNSIALEYSHKYTVKLMPIINKREYDLAISFLTPHYFVAEKVNAKKKIAWIHTDYAEVKVDGDSEFAMWSKYDNIVSISDNVTESFLKIFPKLQSKIVVVENIMPMKYMERLVESFDAEKEMPLDGSIRLLSIGRFSGAKRFDEVPLICKKIIELGINLKWYLIGFGSEEALIRQKIEEMGVQKQVIILGKKENPYPYIKTCDLYVQPSRYEGKSVAVREAQILNKPVIITKYKTASSQLNDGYDGVIVPMDIDDCALGIAKVIRNKELQQQLIENTKKNSYTYADEIYKIYQLMKV